MTGAVEAGRPRYMISVAAELVGMHPQTLRIYEQKGLVRPKRTAGNTRLYSDEDVERLRLIQRLTTEIGLNLAGVERVLLLEDELDRMRRRLDRMEREMREAIDQVHRSYRRDLVLYRPPSRSHRRDERKTDGLQQADSQEPGGRRRRAGACAAAREPRDLPRAPAARAARPGAVRRLAGAARRGRAEARRAAGCERRAEHAAADLELRSRRCSTTPRRAAKLEDDYVSTEHLFLALEPVPRDEILAWIKKVRGGQRVTSQDPEGSYQALAEVRPRPDRGGRGRESSIR